MGRVGSRLTFLEGLEQPEYCTVVKLPESSVAWRCPLPTPSPTPVSPSGAGFALSIPFHIIAAGILSPQFPTGWPENTSAWPPRSFWKEPAWLWTLSQCPHADFFCQRGPWGSSRVPGLCSPPAGTALPPSSTSVTRLKTTCPRLPSLPDRLVLTLLLPSVHSYFYVHFCNNQWLLCHSTWAVVITCCFIWFLQ